MMNFDRQTETPRIEELDPLRIERLEDLLLYTDSKITVTHEPLILEKEKSGKRRKKNDPEFSVTHTNTVYASQHLIPKGHLHQFPLFIRLAKEGWLESTDVGQYTGFSLSAEAAQKFGLVLAKKGRGYHGETSRSLPKALTE